MITYRVQAYLAALNDVLQESPFWAFREKNRSPQMPSEEVNNTLTMHRIGCTLFFVDNL